MKYFIQASIVKIENRVCKLGVGMNTMACILERGINIVQE